MQNKRTNIIIYIICAVILAVVAYAVWDNFYFNKQKLENESAQDKMNREILFSLRSASNDQIPLTKQQKEEIILALESSSLSKSTSTKISTLKNNK